ncbi:trehalose-6-phosphate synthase [Haloarculaceae archaeon H-GB2-1]|nr:trehalose-6-phosphate synthase [Haloarculaceae archaeon H-GB11]MEA5410080.1 trehalose-6-phosphate synthase [Haloarculaceae archaeon H-GB2-1]
MPDSRVHADTDGDRLEPQERSQQRTETPLDEVFGDGFDRQLIVVSNRQPYRHTVDDDETAVDCPVGGLTAGLDPVMQALGGTWVAWGDGDADKQAVDDEDCVSVPPEQEAYTLRRIWLSEEQVDNYYYGFANQVLWPTCHGMLTNVRYEHRFWQHYRGANEAFAAAVADQVSDDDVVWFHDYHLALAPKLVSRTVSTSPTLAHFWHIPWPSPETFRSCPHGRSILTGLLHNDLLGFHVSRDRRNFLDCVDATVPAATVDHERGEVRYRGTTTTVEAIPMGVPVDEIESLVREQRRAGATTSFREAHDVPRT